MGGGFSAVKPGDSPSTWRPRAGLGNGDTGKNSCLQFFCLRELRSRKQDTGGQDLRGKEHRGTSYLLPDSLLSPTICSNTRVSGVVPAGREPRVWPLSLRKLVPRAAN